ncbi:hypothetical protein [Streptomyces sp. SAI-090]|uniref:hypothetical protein n=1 Tax=Streptomyces sp. SAI-090 TaxID=2940545 RepID=UPI002474136D|nr:hypothetical protein [Streptomyces sp. SAI-090]MDH6522183.1 hypothetical protein [Streptomyces sp. SAI-090]
MTVIRSQPGSPKWLSDTEQQERFRRRLDDPVRPPGEGYECPPRDLQSCVPDHAASF